jgi:hypothetical protein
MHRHIHHRAAIHPYDDIEVIAGQATIAKELLEQNIHYFFGYSISNFANLFNCHAIGKTPYFWQNNTLGIC